MSGSDSPNGLAHLSNRAKQIMVLAALGTAAYTGLLWLQAKFVTEPATRSGSASVAQVVRAESDTLRALIRGEGAIRDAADTALWRGFEALRKEVRDGVYSRREIDAMRAASYHRQDSLYRESIRRGGSRR